MKKLTIRLPDHIVDMVSGSNISENIRDILETEYSILNSKKVLSLPEDMMRGLLRVGAEYKVVDVGTRLAADDYENPEDYATDVEELKGTVWICSKDGLFYDKKDPLNRWNFSGTKVEKI